MKYKILTETDLNRLKCTQEREYALMAQNFEYISPAAFIIYHFKHPHGDNRWTIWMDGRKSVSRTQAGARRNMKANRPHFTLNEIDFQWKQNKRPNVSNILAVGMALYGGRRWQEEKHYKNNELAFHFIHFNGIIYRIPLTVTALFHYTYIHPAVDFVVLS